MNLILSKIDLSKIDLSKVRKFRAIFFAIYLVIVFFAIGVLWYSPVLFKGYPLNYPAAEVVTARNYVQQGVFGLEDHLSVVVAPELVKENANPSSLGNKLTPFSYAVIFKFFGQLDWDSLIFVAIGVNALAVVFFAIAVYRVFGFKVAVLFPLVYALIPSIWRLAATPGGYEFPLLYFSVFTLFYFWNYKCKQNHLFLAISGLFLALSCMAKEAMFLFLPIFFIWLVINKKKTELFAIFSTLIIILMFFWVPSFIGLSGNGNDYLKLFIDSNEIQDSHSDFNFYSHLYIDPYSFYFNNQAVVAELNQGISSSSKEFINRIGDAKVGVNMGVRSIGLGERFMAGTMCFIRHIFRYLSVNFIGGPLIFIFIILGFTQLKFLDRKIYYLFLAWLIGVPIILGYVVLAKRNHLMDLGFALAILISLGVIVFLRMLKNNYQIGRSLALRFLVVVLVLYSLFLADRAVLGQAYDDSSSPEIKYLAEKVNNYPISIKADEVIAVGSSFLHPSLNYLTNKSVVMFHPNSITKLVGDGKLQDIFNQFGIKYFIGYDAQTAELIIKNSTAKNISNWPSRGEAVEPLNNSKVWLLNLIN